MDISKKISTLKKRLGFTAALTLAATASYGQDSPQPDNGKADITARQTLNNDSIKKYINVIEISSAEEINNYDIATYNTENNSIICNYFVAKDRASKETKKAIEIRNKDALSPRTFRHEIFHGDVSGLMNSTYNGNTPVKFGDRTRLNILQELCAFHVGNEHASMRETLKYFKDNKFEEHYLRHYQDNQSCGVLLAMMAEPVYGDAQAVYETAYTNQFKTLEIDGKTYISCNYTDGKIQTNLLFNENDDPITGSNILDKVPEEYQIGLVKDMKGNLIKDSKGNPVKSSYLRWDKGKTLIAASDPGRRAIRGYTMTQAKLNYNKIARQICAHAGLSNEDTMLAINYINGLDVDYKDLSTEQITEIRNMYDGKSIEELKQKANENYQAVLDTAKQKRSEEISRLIPFEQLNLVSSNDLKNINIDAFYKQIAQNGKLSNFSR